MSKAIRTPKDHDFLRELPDPRYEGYARCISVGGGPSFCYSQHMAKDGSNTDSIKASAHAFSRRWDISQRIRAIKLAISEAQDAPKDMTGAEILAMFYEALDALTLAADMGEASAIATQSDLSKLRQRTTIVVGRISRAEMKDINPQTDAPPLPTDGLKWCKCAKGSHD
ncbi:MAG: hypothetical protein ACSHWQ_01305 [Spongiibacteraceae bacterium]